MERRRLIRLAIALWAVVACLFGVVALLESTSASNKNAPAITTAESAAQTEEAASGATIDEAEFHDESIAASDEAKYPQVVQEYGASIAYWYFALGCGALPEEADVLHSISIRGSIVENDYMAHGQPPPSAGLLIQHEKSAGRERSRRAGQCDFWARNPDEVARVRAQVINLR